MGTELRALDLAAAVDPAVWNLDAPEQVRRVHRAYLDAGADLLTSNTFGANAIALGARGLDPARAPVLAREGARLAREIAGERALVLGDVGPTGVVVGRDAAEEAVSAAFEEQAAALLDGGADAILVETTYDPRELALAVRAARSAGARQVFATATFQPASARSATNGAVGAFGTFTGASVAEMIRAMEEADVVGANCGKDLTLDDWVRLTAELARAAGGRPVLVRPNAGTPAPGPDGALRWPVGHAEFAAAAPRLVEAGARLVGGCCGAGPAHVAALTLAVGAMS